MNMYRIAVGVSSIVLTTAFLLWGQSVEVTSPAAGDTLFVGDTLTVNLQWDDEMMAAATGLVVKFSYDGGKGYTTMIPIQSQATIGAIPYSEDWAHAPRFVLDRESSEFVVSVEGYSAEHINDQTGCCIVITKPDTLSAPDTTGNPYLRIERPAAGEHIVVGDTVSMILEWNDLPRFMPHGSGIIVRASSDGGGQWIVLRPIQSDTHQNPVIDPSLDWAHVPRFVIPDTLSSPWNLDSSGARVRLSAVSDRFVFNAYLRNYDDEYADTTECCLTVSPRPPDYGTITITSPQPGDTFWVGDTMRVMLETDSAFRAHAPAFVLECSRDSGTTWLVCNPLQFPSSPKVPFYASWALQPQYAVTDTLVGDGKADSSAASDTLLPVWDRVMIRVRATNHHSVPTADSLCCVNFVKNPAAEDDAAAEEEEPLDTEERDHEEDRGACGSGAVSALLVPIGFRIRGSVGRSRRRRRGGA